VGERMYRYAVLTALVVIMLLLVVQHASALISVAVPNGSFEEGTVGAIPDHWMMKTWDYAEPQPLPISTYIHEVNESSAVYFSGSRSCWLHSRVVDTDGTVKARYSHTWIESEDWIDAPTAIYVRFYIRDIQPTHSLPWGWNDGIYLGFIDGAVDNFDIHFIFNSGEYLNFNHYNDTKLGADGATWYEYIYSIPADINKTHFKVQINCVSGDWTFYDTSYFADMHFYVDNVELLSEAQAATQAVGGYSFSMMGPVSVKPLAPYFALMVTLTMVFITVKRKTRTRTD
jgi:hypothetical protein